MGRVTTFRIMIFRVHDVADAVAEHQAQRYHAMSPAEKLAQADALFDLAWAAAKAGVRMRQPDLDDAGVDRAVRALFARAAD